jgi:hypothetical protein
MPLPLKRKQIHHRDRTLHCPNRNLRLQAQQEQISSLTQDPDNAQSQRGTGKTLAISGRLGKKMRTDQTTARLTQDPDNAQSQRGTGRTPTIQGRLAKNPPQQELSKNPTAIGGASQKYSN